MADIFTSFWCTSKGVKFHLLSGTLVNPDGDTKGLCGILLLTLEYDTISPCCIYLNSQDHLIPKVIGHITAPGLCF